MVLYDTQNVTFCADLPQWHRKLVMYFGGLATTLTIIAGCVGNLYSIWAVHLLKISKVLTVYLATLALWDTGLLLCAFSFYALKALLQLFGTELQWLVHLSDSAHGPSVITMTGSVWMVVLITVVRHEALSKPFHHGQKVDSKTKATLICTLIAIAVVLYRIPACFELTVGHCLKSSGDNGNLTNWIQIVPTPLRLGELYQLIYRVLLSFTLVSVLPFLLILALTIRMIILLRQSVTFMGLRHQTSSVRRDPGSRRRTDQFLRHHQLVEQRTTTMLLVLMGKFILCHTLPVILNILEVIGGEAMVEEISFITLAYVSNFLIVLNSATNFVVYILWCKKKAKDRKQRTSFSSSVTVNSTAKHVIIRPLLSNDCETKTLENIWTNFKQKHNIHTVGIEILVSLLAIKPALGKHFDQENSPKLEETGKRIGDFLENVLTAFIRNDIAEAKKLVRCVGRIHFNLHIDINTEMWRKFKRLLIFKALGMRDESFREAHAQKVKEAIVWNKFICFIIAEMKRAMMVERKSSQVGQ